MTVLAYVRVSTEDQSTNAQRHAITERHNVGKWFEDQAVSGATKALERPSFAELFKYAREGDTLVVAAIDRLGRDTLDLLTTVQALEGKGVAVVSLREGFDLSTPIGKAMLTMLGAVAELERSNIKARQLAGITRAKATGQKLGAPKRIDDEAVRIWREANKATIQETATQFSISIAAVKRACAGKSSATVRTEGA
ncbi:recombinase family protein [Pseudomonas phytophila]|uniref:Recombinase family protein n=1 Tax=Pseudomonas phytophila TaxID=2867264 RepID=A0ABY6FD92_9PSED|nr:recombinase family protein [Pseudomonas phytophila]UXZ95870.1 recombinase family protein [Pseudomonas phytophila]